MSDFGRYSCEGFNEIGKDTVEVIFGPETSRCTNIFICRFFFKSKLDSAYARKIQIAEVIDLFWCGIPFRVQM